MPLIRHVLRIMRGPCRLPAELPLVPVQDRDLGSPGFSLQSAKMFQVLLQKCVFGMSGLMLSLVQWHMHGQHIKRLLWWKLSYVCHVLACSKGALLNRRHCEGVIMFYQEKQVCVRYRFELVWQHLLIVRQIPDHISLQWQTGFVS